MTYRKGSGASGGTALPSRAQGPGYLTPVPLCRTSLEVRTTPSFAWVDMRARERRGHLRHTTCLLSTLYELVAVCAAPVVPGRIATQLEYLEASSALRIVRTKDYRSLYVVFLNLSYFLRSTFRLGYPNIDRIKEIASKRLTERSRKTRNVERLI